MLKSAYTLPECSYKATFRGYIVGPARPLLHFGTLARLPGVHSLTRSGNSRACFRANSFVAFYYKRLWNSLEFESSIF